LCFVLVAVCGDALWKGEGLLAEGSIPREKAQGGLIPDDASGKCLRQCQDAGISSPAPSVDSARPVPYALGMNGIETFDNPNPRRDYLIRHVAPEFTSVCPKTGQPDFGTIEIEYVAARQCIELKSLKLYLQGYRNAGVFYEAVVNRILDDLVAACRPRRMNVTGRFTPRGGIHSVVTAAYEARPAKARSRR